MFNLTEKTDELLYNILYCGELSTEIGIDAAKRHIRRALREAVESSPPATTLEFEDAKRIAEGKET